MQKYAADKHAVPFRGNTGRAGQGRAGQGRAGQSTAWQIDEVSQSMTRFSQN